MHIKARSEFKVLEPSSEYEIILWKRFESRVEKQACSLICFVLSAGVRLGQLIFDTAAKYMADTTHTIQTQGPDMALPFLAGSDGFPQAFKS